MTAVAVRTVALGVVYGGTLATIVLALVCRWTPKDELTDMEDDEDV